jgi:hypothetical protein
MATIVKPTRRITSKETGFLLFLWAVTKYSRKNPVSEDSWDLQAKKPGFYYFCGL